MLFKDSLNYFETMDDKLIKKAVKFWMDIPIEKYSFSDTIREWEYRQLPPQPAEELIKIDDITRALGKEGLNIFLAIDHIISLLPNSLYQQIIKTKVDENLIILREFCKKIKSKVDKIHIKHFQPEDSKKEKIMFIIPSQKQLKIVHNNWDKWVWRKRTRDNELAPTEDGWIKDVLELAEALKNEKVAPIIITDKTIEEKVREKTSINVIGVDIPENLAKIGYPRDQSVTWSKHPIIGNMSLGIRRGEEWVINEIYYKLELPPLARIRWAEKGKYIVRAKMEGGNFFLLKTDDITAVLTGIGVRGSNYSTFKILSEILPENVRIIGIPLSGYIKHWAETGAVHLDVVFTYLGNLNGTYYALVDPLRLGFYSGLEYIREKEAFQVIPLGKLFKELNIFIDEPPREKASPITMSNALNLGGGKLMVDAYNKKVNKYLEKEFNIDVIEVNIPQIEAGGGGPRCATREIYI